MKKTLLQQTNSKLHTYGMFLTNRQKNSPATITAGEFCFYENLLFFFSRVVFGTIFVLVCKHIENLGTHVKIGVVD